MMGKNFESIKFCGREWFVTKRIYRLPDGSKIVWQSRHHRKGLQTPKSRQLKTVETVLRRSLWMPRQLNWWIGAIFAIGSLLFMLGSIFSLSPALAQLASLNTTTVNSIFFAGSIPFTTAAYLQLFQAANAGEFSPERPQKPRRIVWFGWCPRDIGWLSCALQFPGTVLFNFNTFDTMLPNLNWLQQDFAVWTPDFVGSILFLASGYLAFMETCHRYWAWKPRSLSWWVTFANLLGCIGFMISAFFSFVPPGTPDADAVMLSLVFTLLGALGFFVGSLLMWPETALLGVQTGSNGG